MPASMPDLIAAHRRDRTDTDLAAETGIPAALWAWLAAGDLRNDDGGPWRPKPGIVASIAAALAVNEAAVRSAIVTSAPADA